MRIHRAALLALTLFAPVALVGAQAACYVAPGSSFGVIAYQCASCGVETQTGGRNIYTFQAEPVVLKVAAGSALRANDVIESVDRHPITTRAGADAYGYPTVGAHAIVVRRNGSRVSVSAESSCADAPKQPAGPVNPIYEAWRGANAARRSQTAITSTRVLPTPSESQSQFGLAVACTGCTKLRPADGPAYWKYESYPTIAALRADGPAEQAGLRSGDVIIRVDGFSVLEQKGAVTLFNPERASSVRITVLRDGKELTVTLQSR